MQENVILTDVDGVMLFWEHAFDLWMREKGYMKGEESSAYDIHELYGVAEDHGDLLSKAFNESIMLSRVAPYKDAIKYVKKLHEEHGYVFHCISAISNTPDTYRAREENLARLFGPTVVERLYLTETSANKKPILQKYENTGCFWIEDVGKNADMGADLGLVPILMERPYNVDYVSNKIQFRVKNWKEIYNIVTTNDK